ncbi:MAG: hypothetical protein Q9163_002657 [Psora crenata]
MAPFIKSTVQIFLGYAQIRIPEKPSQTCPPYVHGDVGKIAADGHPTISTISWGESRLDVYATDASSGQLAHKWWDGYQWGPSSEDTELLGGDSLGYPSAVSDDPGRMDIFVAAINGSLLHKYYHGDGWQPSATGWDKLHGQVKPGFELSTTSWAPSRLDVFFRGVDDHLRLVYYDGSSWGPQGDDSEDLGGEMIGGPAAVSWGPNRNDIFIIDSNNDLSHKYWDGSNWSDWEVFDFGETKFLPYTPSAVSWGVNRLDVFLSTVNNTIAHVYWDGYQWSQLEDFGGDSLTGTVAATASLNRIDIVALSNDSHYFYKFWDGSSWQPSVGEWYPKGLQEFVSAPSVVSWSKNANQRFDIFGVTPDQKLAHQAWTGDGWFPGPDQWETLGGSLSS